MVLHKNRIITAIFIIIILGGVFFITIRYFIGGGQYPPIRPEERYCEKDNDCDSVIRDCCPYCSPESDAVNRESREKIIEWKEQNCLPCPFYVSCIMPNYTYVPYCENNLCTQKKDTWATNCFYLQNYWDRHMCQYAFTFPDKSVEFCESEENKDNCYMSIAIESLNQTYCSKIESDEKEVFCLERVEYLINITG
jgi:hypothetical protein